MLSSVRVALLVSLLFVAVPPLAQAGDASVAARLDARGLEYTVDDDGDFKITSSHMDGARTQLVFVSGGTESIGGFTIREVFAPAGRVRQDGIDGDTALALLAESRNNKLGGWELGGDVLYFVIKLPDSVDAAQLETALAIAARTADAMELELSGDRDEL